MRLYRCVLWRSYNEIDPTVKYMWCDWPVSELMQEFIDLGYTAVHISDITDVEVDSYEM
jgi:hypothetical protein